MAMHAIPATDFSRSRVVQHPMPKDTNEKGEENHFRKCARDRAGLVADQIIPK